MVVEVRVGKSFVGFTYQTNPLVILILFQNFFQDRRRVFFLEKKALFKFGWSTYSHKKLQKEGYFWEEKSMVDFIII